MHEAVDGPDERFAAVVEEFLGCPGVTSPGGKGFGASGLRIKGKIFAMLSSRGAFVVKLPARRVEALIASGVGTHFDPGHSRLMREWLALESTADKDWHALAREAMTFVGGSGSKE